MIALPTAIAAAMEAAINQVLQLDPESLARLQKLQGKVIAIELRGLNIAFYLIPTDAGLNVFSHFAGEPDTILSGYPLSMARMSMATHASDSLLSGDVEIRGDMELGQKVQDILDGLDIDWEEHLSRISGDMVAHKLGDMVRGALDWGRKTLDTLGQDAAEYLQEESRELPVRSEVNEFIAQVDTLRSDTDRIEARIKRLQDKLRQKQNKSGDSDS